MQRIDHKYHPSTGALAFKGDWPGLFIRGDDVMELVTYCRHCLNPKCKWKERLATLIMEDILRYSKDVIVEQSWIRQ